MYAVSFTRRSWIDLDPGSLCETIRTRLDRSHTRLDRSQFTFERPQLDFKIELTHHCEDRPRTCITITQSVKAKQKRNERV